MLKIFKEDFIYNFVNNTVFMTLMIAVSIYSLVTIHSLKVENAEQAKTVAELSATVRNIRIVQTKLGMQMQTALSAESVALANLSQEVKAQSLALEKAQAENHQMIIKLKQLKREIKRLGVHT